MGDLSRGDPRLLRNSAGLLHRRVPGTRARPFLGYAAATDRGLPVDAGRATPRLRPRTLLLPTSLRSARGATHAAPRPLGRERGGRLRGAPEHSLRTRRSGPPRTRERRQALRRDPLGKRCGARHRPLPSRSARPQTRGRHLFDRPPRASRRDHPVVVRSPPGQLPHGCGPSLLGGDRSASFTKHRAFSSPMRASSRPRSGYPRRSPARHSQTEAHTTSSIAGPRSPADPR